MANTLHDLMSPVIIFIAVSLISCNLMTKSYAGRDGAVAPGSDDATFER